MAKRLAVAWICLIALCASAREAVPAAADPVLEARMLKITGELRCLVCQNQTIADSHAGLAEDLREEVRILLRNGQSDEQVVQYMTDRYGDFVRYRPLLKPTTFLLWFGPAGIVIGGLIALVVVLRRRMRMPDDRFELDELDEIDPMGSHEPAGYEGRPS
jgi:cytochrome c-type biogenesis protein CcmH